MTGSPTKKNKEGATSAAMDDIQAAKSQFLLRHPKAAKFMAQLSTLAELRHFGVLLDKQKRRKSKASPSKKRRGKSTGSKSATPSRVPEDNRSTTMPTPDARHLHGPVAPIVDPPRTSDTDVISDTVSRRVVQPDIRTSGVDLASGSQQRQPRALDSPSSAARGSSFLGASDGLSSAPRTLPSSSGVELQDNAGPRIGQTDVPTPGVVAVPGSEPALTVLQDLKVGFANVTVTAVALGPQLQSKTGNPYRQAMVGDSGGTTMRMVGFGKAACDKMDSISPGSVFRMEKVKVVRANQQYQSTESTNTKELQVNSYTADKFKATPLRHLQAAATHITRLANVRTADKGAMVNIAVVVLAVRFHQRGSMWTCHALCMDCPEIAIDVAFAESHQHSLGFNPSSGVSDSHTVQLPFSMIVENVLVAHEGLSTYLRAVPLSSVHRHPAQFLDHSEPERLAATQAFAKLPMDFRGAFSAFQQALTADTTFADVTSAESAMTSFYSPYLISCTPIAQHTSATTGDIVRTRHLRNHAFSTVNPEAFSGNLVNVASLTWHAHWYPLQSVPKHTLLMVHNAAFEPHAVSVMLCNVSVSKTKKGALSVGLQVEDDSRTMWVNVYGPVLEGFLGVSSEQLDEMAASGELPTILHEKLNNRINLRLRLLPRENANPHICVQEIGHADTDVLEQEAPSAALA